MVNIIKTTKNSTTGIDIVWQLEIMNGSKKNFSVMKYQIVNVM